MGGVESQALTETALPPLSSSLTGAWFLRSWSCLSMKAHTEYLTFNVSARMGFLNITPDLERIVRVSGIQEGLLLCNAMHITASVFINDDESGLHEDYKTWLEALAPFDPSPPTVQAQPHRRGQRRRPHEAAGHGAGGRHRRDQRQVGLRPLGAGLLRRVRRTTPEASPGQGHRGMNGREDFDAMGGPGRWHWSLRPFSSSSAPVQGQCFAAGTWRCSRLAASS